MNQIHNLIFDLGGVLLDIDTLKTFEAFENLGLFQAEQWFTKPEGQQLCTDAEIGTFEPDEVRLRFSNMTGIHCTDEEFDSAWNALLGDFYPERIHRIRELNRTFQTYLLSNTNAIHCHHFNTNLKKQFGIESLDHLLTKAWYSHDLKLRKPDPEIFRKILILSQIDPDETLFLDDSEANVQAARSVGMKAVLITHDFTMIHALNTLSHTSP